MFKYATAHTAVISTAALRRLFSAAGDFSFRWCAMASSFAGPNSSRLFSAGLSEKSVQYSPYRVTCTQRKYKGRNRQIFRINTSSPYAHLHNSCAPVRWGGWWPPKRQCTQKEKLCKKKKTLSTIVNCEVLKLVSITFIKMLFLFIISSLFLPHPV